MAARPAVGDKRAVLIQIVAVLFCVWMLLWLVLGDAWPSSRAELKSGSTFAWVAIAVVAFLVFRAALR